MAVQMELAHRCEMTARCRRQTNYLQPRLKTPTDSQTKGDGVWGGCNELSVLSQAAHPGPWVLFVRSICGDPTCTDSMAHSRCKGVLGKASAHPTS